jgi:hypothetical protein
MRLPLYSPLVSRTIVWNAYIAFMTTFRGRDIEHLRKTCIGLGAWR